MKKQHRMLVLFLLALTCNALNAAVRYVKSVASGSGNGSSWVDASADLQAMINASGDGDQVWVAAGTYKPTSGTDRTISFIMKNGVQILGGFPNTGNPGLGDRNWSMNITTLSGEIGGGGNSDNSYHVIANINNSLINTAILDGFVITGGNASTGSGFTSLGGGILNFSASPTLINCIFRGNSANSGGGVFNSMSAPVLSNCSFIGNSANNGGAINNQNDSSPKFTNCSFSGNSAGTRGGGLFNRNSPGIIFTNCIFWGNSSEIFGDVDPIPAITYSIVKGGFSGTGNLDQNPLFVSQPSIGLGTSGNLHLQPCSPAIDAGTANGAPATDLDGNARPFDAVPNVAANFDMGAYEYQSAAPMPTVNCHDLHLPLGTGNASVYISPSAIADNIPTDCGAVALINGEEELTFDCSHMGDNPVTLTVVFTQNGRSATCNAIVTVEEGLTTMVCPKAGILFLASEDCIGVIEAYYPIEILDNCIDLNDVIVTQNPEPGAWVVGHGATQTVTLVATDGYKSYSCQFTVTAVDVQKPTFTCPTPALVLNTTGAGNCMVNIPDLVALVTDAADNCALKATNPVTQSIPEGAYSGVSDGNTIPVTVTVTDVASNSTSCTVTFTVNDDDAPAFTCPTPTLVLNTTGAGNCTVNIPNLVSLVTDAVDNCALKTANPVTQNIASGTYGGVSDSNTIPVIVTVTDNASPANSYSCTVTFTVNDDDQPTFTCPTPALVLNTTGGNNCTVNIPNLVALVTDAADNCALKTSNPITQSIAAGPYGGVSDGSTFPVTVTVTDNASPANSRNCTVTFTVNDDDKPGFTCPTPALVLNTTSAANCSVNIPDLVSMVTDAADNCALKATNAVTQSIAAGPYSGSSDGSTIPVTVTVTDNATPANSHSCTVTFTVNDDKTPAFTCPTPALVLNTTGAGNCTVNIPDLVALVTDASDNCALKTNNPVTQSIAAGAYGGVSDGSTIPVTITVTDNALPANNHSCTVTFTVNDDDKPVFTCPTPALVLNTTGAANCSVNIPNLVALVTDAVDNCALKATNAVTQSIAAGTYGGVSHGATISVVVTVTDNASPANSTTCTVTFTVNDDDAPLINCPANLVKYTEAGQCGATTTYTVTASDNCSYNLMQTNGLPSGTSFPAGLHVMNWRATDSNGNTATCSFTVTVIDNQFPGIVCPGNITKTTEPGQCSAMTVYSTPTFSDNCTGVSLVRTSGPASSTAFATGTTMVIWRATDSGGNSSVCSFTVTVNDGQAPTLTCPAGQTKSTDPGQCSAVVTYVTPAAFDNCAGVSTALQSGPVSGSAFPKGSNTVVWKATDVAGLTAICSFVVTVNDNQAPVITCPANQTQITDPNLCTAVVNYAMPTFTDNCAGGSVSLQSGLASNSAFPKGQTTVVWKATDAAGLTKTCTFRVTINDTQAPGIACPANQTKTTEANLCTAAATYANATFTDNCTGGSVVKLSGLNSGAAFPKGTNNVVFKATDAAGNQTLCTMTITVTDVQLPVVVCPTNLVVTGTNANGVCSAMVTYNSPTATDNCGIYSNFQWSGLASGSVFPQGLTTNIWKATDDSGLTATCAFTVTVGCGTSPEGTMNYERGTMNEERSGSSSFIVHRLSFTLTPNPATTQVQLRIEGLDERGGTLTVFDVQGRVVWQQMLPGAAPSVIQPIQVADFQEGLYQVRLQTASGIVTKGLVIMK